jgi:hypothetical protein
MAAGLQLIFFIPRNKKESEMTSARNYTKKPLNHKQQKFIIQHNHCVLCNSKLKIESKMDNLGQKIIETAYCSKCDVVARKKTYPFH